MWYENWITLREAKAISHLRVLIFGDRLSQLAFVEDARLPKAWINPYLTMTGCKYAAFKALEECKDYSHQEVRIGEIYHLSP
jgi:hypothetical protein